MKDDPECMPSGFEKEGLDRAYSHWSVYEKSYGTCFTEAWRITEALLERFSSRCKSEDVKLIIVAFPLKIEIDEEWRMDLMNHYDIDANRFDFQKPYLRLAAFCRRHGIGFIYPQEEFKVASQPHPLYFQNDSHPNQYGHAAAAQAVLKMLRERYNIPFTINEPDLAYYPVAP